MDAAGVSPEDIRSIHDLPKLPFTRKSDLRDSYPFGLFAVDMKKVVRIHASSGTTGRPTVVGYSRQDIETWSELMTRALKYAGVGEDDVIQIAYGYGLFTGGLGMHYGAEKLGASVIPISGGNTQRQIQLMQDFETTVLACTPSYALYIAETMEKLGVDPKDLKLRVGIFGAEPWTEEMRQEIQERLAIKAFDIYGLSEIMGPGVACECTNQDGLHLYEDHFIPEIIDPATGEQLPLGEVGELVITTVTKEALPLLRYRTGDITVLNAEKCSCGLPFLRMSKVMGRTDDMLIIRGVNVFPSQIEAVLLGLEDVEPHYQLVVDRKGALDDAELWVEVPAHISLDEVRRLEQLSKKIDHAIQSTLGIRLQVKLVEPKTIPRGAGKAQRVVDRRSLYKLQREDG
ncbi:MAG: phenylacetate--CoA ligase [Firmicutes bacterium]|nr:phenylacetate--CoA ligase [Bacillota bacterium]